MQRLIGRSVTTAAEPGVRPVDRSYDLLDAGALAEPLTVQRALGNSSATTTLNTYSHLWPTAEDRTRKASEAMMETSSGTPADSVRTNVT